jgi:hypothetical protein
MNTKNFLLLFFVFSTTNVFAQQSSRWLGLNIVEGYNFVHMTGVPSQDGYHYKLNQGKSFHSFGISELFYHNEDWAFELGFNFLNSRHQSQESIIKDYIGVMDDQVYEQHRISHLYFVLDAAFHRDWPSGMYVSGGLSPSLHLITDASNWTRIGNQPYQKNVYEYVTRNEGSAKEVNVLLNSELGYKLYPSENQLIKISIVTQYMLLGYWQKNTSSSFNYRHFGTGIKLRLLNKE